jgi:ABC-type antimicrobial peptide transport system permease subunit
MFYIPSGQSPMGAPYLMFRTDGEPGALLGAVRSAVTSVHASLPIVSQGTMADHFGAALSGPRIAAALMATVSVIALLLAALGIYALVSFNVARRSSELGIRMALGAKSGRVVGMVVRETLAAVTIGIACGLTLSIFLVGRLDAVLFGIEPLDPVTFVGTVAFLIGVASVAAYLPARRAARIDPVKALRAS